MEREFRKLPEFFAFVRMKKSTKIFSLEKTENKMKKNLTRVRWYKHEISPMIRILNSK